LPPAPVVDAVIAHLKREEAMGGYEAAAAAAPQITAAYDSVARLINAKSDEIAFVENATRAWDMAFYSLAFMPGDRILTARAEYASNYIAFLQISKKTGAVVDVVPSEATGEISLSALEAMIDDRVKLIAITHVPTNGGLINPAAAVGKRAGSGHSHLLVPPVGRAARHRCRGDRLRHAVGDGRNTSEGRAAPAFS
jgi:selenocysteine lyase/cysteine desulfurase